MDLRHMRHFVAVAEELHFGRAAKRLNMAQPPLSQSIRRLEADLGVQLLKRSRRGVDLTDVGRVFLVQARRTLMQADLARKTAQRSDEKSPEVRISFMNAALYSILPQLVARFRRERPDVILRLHEQPSPDQVSGLFSGNFDLGIILPGTPQSENLERLVVERAAFMAVVPTSWPIAQREEISLRELAEQPFIRPPEHYGHRIPRAMSLFESIGVAPNVIQVATQMNTMMALVGAGIGCGIITATARFMHVEGAKLIRIADHPANSVWELHMVWNPDHLDPAAQDFLSMVRAHLAENPALLTVDPAIG